MKQFNLDRQVQRQMNAIERMFKKELKASKIKIGPEGGLIGLAILGAIGIGAYLILTNKDLSAPPVPVVDPFIDELGDLVPGVEGLADETFLEDLPIGSSAPSKDAAYVSAYQAQALAAGLSDRLSVA